jgi:cell division inhibitor SepF
LVKFASVWPRSGRAEYEEWSSAHEMSEVPPDTAWNSPQRLHIVNPTSFEDGARSVADRFKRHQSVILNLQRADQDLAKRMVDFCAGLSYALDGRMQPIVEGLFLLTPSDVEVSSKESPRDAQKAFFNRL